MARPCVEDGCGLHLAVDDDTLTGNVVISEHPCNALTCIPGEGVFAYEDESLNQAGTCPVGGGGFTVDLSTLALDVPTDVTDMTYAGVPAMPTTTFRNESACLPENVILAVTAREIYYSGDEGAWFTVNFQQDFNGGGFVDLFNIVSDYRFTHPGGILDGRAGGAAAGGIGLAAGGFFTYRYRILVTTHTVMAPGAGIVTGPGLTWCHLAATN